MPTHSPACPCAAFRSGPSCPCTSGSRPAHAQTNNERQTNKLDVDTAHKVAWGWTAGIALLYPFNAKFSVLGDYPCKYPMHYVPEALMSTFCVLGALAK